MAVNVEVDPYTIHMEGKTLHHTLLENTPVLENKGNQNITLKKRKLCMYPIGVKNCHKIQF